MVTTRTGAGKRPVRGIDALSAVFDDDRVVANAGLVLPATLAGRLGLEALCDTTLDLGERPGAARPGRKVMSILHAMLLGADSIDDCAILRTGRTAAVLGHRAMAPSTLGTFLRAFTFGHVRQLDRVAELAMARAWAAGAGPGEDPMTIDLRRAGARGPLTLRADSGFWSARVIGACARHGIRFSIAVRGTAPIRRAIAAIAEADWQPIDDTTGGLAQVAETPTRELV